MNTKRQTKTTATVAKRNECVCGCGKKVRHLFAQGHDQRVRGMLIRAASEDGYKLPGSMLQAIKAGLLKHLERVRPNARILTSKAA